MRALGMGSRTADLGWMEGLNRRTQEEMAVLVQYGELAQVAPARPVPGKPWLVRIPYRRLAPAGTARKRRTRRLVLLWTGGIGVYGLTMLWMLWEARYIVLAAAGAAIALLALWALVRVLTGGGCAGIHTPGCSCGG